MAKFPVVSSKQLIAFFKQHEFRIVRQRGGHTSLKREGIPGTLTIPQRKALPIGIIKNNLKTAGIPKEVFRAAMQGGKKSR